MKQKFVKIVCEAFFIKKKNILLSHLGLIVIFIKKRLFKFPSSED
jgi:hypothetical protein